MSNYSNVTEQGLINLRKLAEQRKNQRAIDFKIRISKQTQDIKLAESIPTISKNLSEVKESAQKIGEIINENKTPQLLIENTGNEIPIKNERRPLGVIYDTSKEKTLSNMQKQRRFF